MGILETAREFRRRGFASSCVVELTRRFLGHGMIPYCYIWVDNAPSIGLFEKLGFHLGKRGRIVMFRPQAEGEAKECNNVLKRRC